MGGANLCSLRKLNYNFTNIITFVCLLPFFKDIECLSIDDGIIVTASLDGMVYVWDLGQRQCSTAIDRRYMKTK